MIQLGDVNGVLKLRKTPLRNLEEWRQYDSDVLGHLVNVQIQLQESKWANFNISYQYQGSELLNCTLPTLEDFLFAAVYLRQCIADRDRLLDKAVKIYCKFNTSDTKEVWIKHELSAFTSKLTEKYFASPNYTTQELFDAFVYGSSLLHVCDKPGKPKRELFLKILRDNENKHKEFFSLNAGLKQLAGHISKIALLINHDFGYWLANFNVPKPEIYWHNKLFEVKVPER